MKLNSVSRVKNGEARLVRLAKAWMKAQTRYRCNVFGKPVTAPTESELRAKVEAAVRSKFRRFL